MGRFMSPDWSERVEPVPYAKLGDPQSLNLYAYVMNNPMARVDVDGHLGSSWDEFDLQQKGVDAQKAQQAQAAAEKAQQQGASQSTQLRDVSPSEGEQILKVAEGMEGTPYMMGGNNRQGIDCIHMVRSALNKAGIAARANANANDFQRDVNLRPLGPKEQPRTGDIVQWKHQPTGHVGVYDANPPKHGYNIYSATNHGVMHLRASDFSNLGTPTFYRVEVPQ
jgi:cell wall-associated NlpC family hydrolase